MSVETIRRIVLLRHAKADWGQETDHERPLAERGRKDAPVAGRRLAQSGIDFGLALCSTAARTRETWKLAVHELAERPRTVYEERIYEASPGELIALLDEVPEDVDDVLVIGHNPGVHGLARMNHSGFPTAAYAVLTFTGNWKSVEPGSCRLVEFWTPHD